MDKTFLILMESLSNLDLTVLLLEAYIQGIACCSNLMERFHVSVVYFCCKKYFGIYYNK